MKRLPVLVGLLLFALIAVGSAQEQAAAPISEADTSQGEQVFQSSCVSCHQQSGQGVPGAFPPLAGHAPDLATAEGGRDYLVNVLLYGLQGEIEVEGHTYNGVMPPWRQLGDEEIASLLNYILTAWDNQQLLPEDFPAFTADEVAPKRENELSSQQVYELRQALELSEGGAETGGGQ